MKKFLVVSLLASFCLVTYGLLPALAIEGMTTIKTSDLYSLVNRKSYRLGLRLSTLSPTKDILLTKDSAMELGLEFDAKLNENVDSGPRFGLMTFKANTGGYNATYTVMRFGFGGRLYGLYWGDYGSTHGFVNGYICAEGNYYVASKASEVSLNSPTSFAGLGGLVGAGLEFAFGPNTGAFVEADYQRTSVKDSSNNSLPLDGFIVALGARMAFF